MSNELEIGMSELREVAARLQEKIKFLPVMIEDEVYDDDIRDMEKWADMLYRHIIQQEKEEKEIYG